MKRLAIVALLILITSFGVGNSQVKADDSAYDWCYLFGGGYGIDPLLQVVIGVAGHSIGSYNAILDRWNGWKGSSESSISVEITLPLGSTFTSASFNFIRTGGGSAGTNRSYFIRDLITGTSLTGGQNRFSGLQTVNAPGINTNRLRFVATGYGGSGIPDPGVYSNRIELKGTGIDPFEGTGSGNLCATEDEYVRPLSQSDEDDWGLFEVAQDFSPGVLAISNTAGADVYAAAAGVVTLIEPLTLYPCRSWIGPIALTDYLDDLPILPELIDNLPGYIPTPNLEDFIPCSFEVPPEAHGVAGQAGYVYTIGSALWTNPGIAGSLLGGRVEGIDDYTVPGVWRVRITTGDLLLGNSKVFEYFVGQADEYIAQGDAIQAGCVLGKTVPMRGFALSLDLSEALFRPLADQGVAFVGFSGEPITGGAPNEFGDLFSRNREEVLSKLTIYPEPQNACNTDPDDRTCLGDVRLLQSSDWDVNGQVVWNEEGATLYPRASITADFNLDPTRNLYVDTLANTVAGSGRLHVTISDVDTTFSVTTNNTNYRTSDTTPVPNAGIFFRLRLENTGPASSVLEITRVCVSNGGGGGEGPPVPVEPPPFAENCTIVTQPITETLVAQIGWLWARSNQFFQCDLMRMLNRMFKLSQDAYRLMGWLGRYWVSSVIMWSRWVSTDGIPWLSGHFANIANGRQTFIQVNGSETCNNLFCLFTSLFGGIENIFDDLANTITTAITQVLAPITGALINLLNLTAGFIFNLLTAIISIALRLVGLVLSSFGIVFSFFGTITDAWNNSAAITIPGLPYCGTNPQANGFCIFLWMAEHTIFSGRGVVIIPLIVGYFSALLIIWGIKEINSTILEAGKAI